MEPLAWGTLFAQLPHVVTLQLDDVRECKTGRGAQEGCARSVAI